MFPTNDLVFFALALIAAVCAVLLVYPYILYPAILSIFPRQSIRRGLSGVTDGGRFSLLFCAYNEAASMPSKLANIQQLKTRYPQLSVLVFDDGSVDGTADLIEREAPYVRVIRGAGRRGKANGMKRLAAIADTEFLVFTDANVLLDTEAIDHLTACFADPTVGGVCGALRYLGAEDSSTASVGNLYWRLEERIKDLESATGSVMGADGSVFSIRRSLYPSFPDYVLDDLTVSMECVFRGYRLVKANDVVAYEKLVSSRSDEFSRKVRIAARAFGTHRYLRNKRSGMSMLNRFKYASHKTIRWFGGAFLIIGVFTGVGATAAMSPLLAAGLVAIGVLLLAAGMLTSRGIFSSCVEIAIAMIATLIGVGRAVRGRTETIWNPAKSRSP